MIVIFYHPPKFGSRTKNVSFLFGLQGLTDICRGLMEKDTNIMYIGLAMFTYESFMLTVLPFLIA